MEIHQVIGLVAAQIVIAPAAYAASAIIESLLHVIARRRLATSVVVDSNWIDPRVGFFIVWVTFNAIFMMFAGVV